MSELSESFEKLVQASQDLDDALAALKADTSLDTITDENLDENLGTHEALVSTVERAIQNLMSQVNATETAANVAADELASSTVDLSAATALQDSEGSDLVMTQPVQLTKSGGGNEYARMDINSAGDIWVVWHSTRTGSEEVYVSKYFGQCGMWNMPGAGGEDLKITNFGQEGNRAMFPSVSMDSKGEAHIVFQGEISGRWEIFYSHSTGGGASFTQPIRITRGEGDAMMPGVTVVKTGQDQEGSAEKAVIVWHDSRFGGFEIMSAQRIDGVWQSTGQDGSDIRITSAEGDSMFPRIDSDFQGNIRVVYHDSRRGLGRVGIYMSTFVVLSDRWDSSAQGGSDRLISNSPSDALHPDISIDHTGGTTVAWHDLRNMEDNPDQHEEVYALYCPRMGHPGGVHFPPLQPNIEARLDIDFEIVDCVNFEVISLTNAPEVCIMIRAPGATFWRAANEDGEFTDWQQFRPNFDLETTVVPWTLTCVGGQKKICVQVQDAEMVGFPVCRDVTLAIQPPRFEIEFFQDEEMTIALPEFKGRPVAREGDVFVKLTSDVPQLLEPTFEVISRGQHLIFNQRTETVSGFSGFSGANSAGIGSFIGTTVNVPREDDVSPVSKAFSAAIGRIFKARFHVKKDDDLLHLDGLARLIPTGQDICGPIKSARKSDQETAIVTAAADDAGADDPTDFTSPEPPPQPDIPDLGEEADAPFTIFVGEGSPHTSNLEWFSFGGSGGRTSPTLGTPSSFLNYGLAQPFTLPRKAKLDKIRTRIVKDTNVGSGIFAVLQLAGDTGELQHTKLIDLAQKIEATSIASSSSGLPSTASFPLIEFDFGGVSELLAGKYFVIMREADIEIDASDNSFENVTGGLIRNPGGNFFIQGSFPRGPNARMLTFSDGTDPLLDARNIFTNADRDKFLDQDATISWPGVGGYRIYVELDFVPV